ncbi:11844_t:CDS:2, partial [Racocetra persica]
TKRPFQVARIGKWNLTGDGGCDMFVFLSFNKKDRGFLVPIQIKYRSTENLQIYDPKINYEGGSKTLNHYLRDFDELLSRMILDENESSFRIRYGIFIVNNKVHIPEWYPSTTNVVIGKQTQFYGSGETILNKTDRAMIAAHTDT